MVSDSKAMLLDKIAIILAEDGNSPPDGTLLYARLENGMAAPSIFRKSGDVITFRSLGEGDFSELVDLLFDLWEIDPIDKRWSIIEYLIENGRFKAVFAYPEDIDPEEDFIDRRQRIVKQYFGDKPVVYPALAQSDGYDFSF